MIHYGGGGTPTSIISGWLYFEKPTLKLIGQLFPELILIKAEQARSLALYATLQLLASEMSYQAPGSEVVANRLAEVLLSRRFARMSPRALTATILDGSGRFSIRKLGRH